MRAGGLPAPRSEESRHIINSELQAPALEGPGGGVAAHP